MNLDDKLKEQLDLDMNRCRSCSQYNVEGNSDEYVYLSYRNKSGKLVQAKARFEENQGRFKISSR